MTFEDFRAVFFVAVALFIVFGLIQMFAMKARWNEPPRPRTTSRRETTESGVGSTSTDGALHGTFGTSGISASDVSPAGYTSTTPVGTQFESSDCDTGDTSGDCGGDSGGGDSGGGGWND